MGLSFKNKWADLVAEGRGELNMDDSRERKNVIPNDI